MPSAAKSPVVGLLIGSIAPTYGAARVAIDLSTGLIANGRRVVILTFDGDETEQRRAVPAECDHVHLRRGEGIGSWLTLAWRLRRFVRQQANQIDLVPFMTFANLAGALSVWRRPTNLRRLIMTEHNIQSVALPGMGWTGRLAKLLMPLLYRRADAVVGVSNAVVDDLVQRCGVPSQMCSTIYNPIDLRKIQAMASQPLAVGLQPYVRDDFYVSVAALKPAKRTAALVSAFSKFEGDARLLLIGDGEDREELEDLVARLHLESRVIFVGRLENPWPIVKLARAHLLFPAYEGFGLVAAECAALNVRPIGSATGGLGEVVAGVGGEILASEELLPSFLSRVEELPAYAANRQWLEQLDVRTVARKYERILDGE